MVSKKSLPYPAGHDSAESYVESLLTFITSSVLLQTLCGGVHILDFLTLEPDLYTTILPEEWRQWFLNFDVSDILDLLMREDIDQLVDVTDGKLSSDEPAAQLSSSSSKAGWRGGPQPPLSLLQFVSSVRKHTLDRTFYDESKDPSSNKPPPLSRHIAVGMKPKKTHEVENFAAFIDGLTTDISKDASSRITHLVDFGSGQNYLGRTLASSPYERRVVAVESKQSNITGAKSMDVSAKLAEKKRIMRNKKAYRAGIDPVYHESHRFPERQVFKQTLSPIVHSLHSSIIEREGQTLHDLTLRSSQSSKNIQYIESTIGDGDLTAIVDHIAENEIMGERNHASNAPSDHKYDSSTHGEVQALTNQLAGIMSNRVRYFSSDISSSSFHLNLMIISLHSCGNLIHHGLRSLILNQSVKAVAMVGCCYNLMTERLGPPTFKLQTLRCEHPRLDKTSSACDPHGFPMSSRLATYAHGDETGIRLNITARMMAVQAPQNWTPATCEAFFTRHFYRAMLQRVFLDRRVVEKPIVMGNVSNGGSPRGWTGKGEPIIIGSLRKACYVSFVAYVRGALEKLRKDELHKIKIQEHMADLTDDEIVRYEHIYEPRKKDLSIIWSFMAFAAGVVESVIVVDRWLFLREQASVKDCWVQSVFDYEQSPRNLVVVGVKS